MSFFALILLSLNIALSYFSTRDNLRNLSESNMMVTARQIALAVRVDDGSRTVSIQSRQQARDRCKLRIATQILSVNTSGEPIQYVQEMRRHMIAKINRVLNTDIESFMEVEDVLDPYLIEQRTGSSGGSLYGNSSNNKYAAFLRHANNSSRIKNLYFCGGSVHPGGGIPLGLLSAKIVAEMIAEKA